MWRQTLGEGAVTDKVFLYTESQKPDEQMTAFEDEHGTYFMNSKDLRAVQHVEKLTALWCALSKNRRSY